MGRAIRISADYLDVIINNLQEKGDDVTELEAIRDSLGHKPPRLDGKIRDDEEHIRLLMEQSAIEEGDNLECPVCGSGCNKLISGVCETCFRPWALSTNRQK